MKKALLFFILTMLLSSCVLKDGIFVSLKNYFNTVVKKTGLVVTDFGNNGSVSLRYGGLDEEIGGNFKPLKSLCTDDGTCFTLLRLSTTGKDLLVKILNTGEIDPSFGSYEGRYFLDNVFREQSGLISWELVGKDEDNKIYLSNLNKIMRILPSGQRDVSFGQNGVVTLDRTVQNFAPIHLLKSASNELIFYSLTRPGGSSVSFSQFGTALISLNKSGVLTNSTELGNQSIIAHENYNTYAVLSSLLSPLVEDEAGTLVYYTVGIASNGTDLRIVKKDFENQSIGGFNFNGGVTYTIGSNLDLKKVFIQDDYLYLFLTSKNVSVVPARLIVVNKLTGVVDAVKSRSFTAPSTQPYSIEDVTIKNDGFVLALKTCPNMNCLDVIKYMLEIDFDGLDVGAAVSVFSKTYAAGQLAGLNNSQIFKQGVSFYYANFSLTRNTLYLTSSALSVSKMNENFILDTSFGVNGEKEQRMDYDFPINLLMFDDNVVMDNQINSYYLVSYYHSGTNINKIIKLDSNIQKVSSFATNGILNLESTIDVNSIELDRAKNFLYLSYTDFSGGNASIYLRRYLASTGVLDASFGSGTGRLLLFQSPVDSVINSFSGYYGSQISKRKKRFPMFSYANENEMIFTFADVLGGIGFSMVRVDFETETVSSYQKDLIDLPGFDADKAFVELNNFKVFPNTQKVVVHFKYRSISTNLQSEALTVFNQNDLSLLTSAGNNNDGIIYLPNNEMTSGGGVTQAKQRTTFKITENYIFILILDQYIKLNLAGTDYEKVAMKYYYERIDYNGQNDVAFYNYVQNIFQTYENTLSSKKSTLPFYILQTSAVFHSESMMSFLFLDMGTNTFADLMNQQNQDLNVYWAKVYLNPNGSIESSSSKVINYLDYLNSLQSQEGLVVGNEKYSFEREEYSYKISMSGADEYQHPVYSLYKVNK